MTPSFPWRSGSGSRAKRAPPCSSRSTRTRCRAGKAKPEDVAGILIDLAQRETKTFSVQFAQKLIGTIKQTTRLHKEPLKSAGFRVLRAPDVPSVLVELGYVSNKEDLQSLSSDGWRDRTAKSMAAAIDGYFATHLAGARAGSN